MIREATYYGQWKLYRTLYEKSADGGNFNDLMPLILERDNILLAYRYLKSNKGSRTAGIDKETVEQVKKLGVDEVVARVRRKLNNYHPIAVRRVYIPKKNGKKRPLGIPAFIDRLIQQCIKQILEPIFEAKFFKHSYSFRPGRSQNYALARCTYLINRSNCRYVIELDLEAFFDNVDFTRLCKTLWNHGIHDERLLTIIRKMLHAPIQGEGTPTKGVPQGAILSPLLSNIYLHEFDRWFVSQYEENSTISEGQRRRTRLKIGFLVRFADDIRIFTRTRSEAIRWFHAIQQWFHERLRLNCSQEKTRIVNIRKTHTHFLGIEMKAIRKPNKPRRVCRSHIGNEELRKINTRYKAELKTLLKTHPARFPSALAKTMSYIRGARNYYRAATMVYEDLARVDSQNWRVKQKLKKRQPYLRDKSSRSKDPNSAPSAAKKRLQGLSLSHGIKYKKLLCHSQEIYYNTVSPISCWQTQLDALRDKVRYGTIEFADNVLSLYTQQRGKDPVTGYLLDLDSLHCHHKVPKCKGGTDCFRNLILLDQLTHRVVHSSLQAVGNFCYVLRLSKRRREKLLTLWHLAKRN